MLPGGYDVEGVTAGIVVPAPIVEAIHRHARGCLPDEACGLVAVSETGQMQMAYPLSNAEASPHRFTIEPIEHFGAVRHAESMGWRIGAVFHSHPSGGAVPSPTDLGQPHDPNWLHLIVGFTPGPHLRAWRIEGDRPAEVSIVSRDARTAS